MKIESINCPNCGGTLKVIPGMKQTYCGYCNAFLVIGNDTSNPQGANNQYLGDNPVSLRAIKEDVLVYNSMYNSAASDWREATIRFIETIAAISYLTETYIPVFLGTDSTTVHYAQKIRKGLLGERLGVWKEMGTDSSLKVKELVDRYGLQVQETKENEIENTGKWHAHSLKHPYPTMGDCNIKHVVHEYKYTIGVTPDIINQFKDIKRIIDNAQNNQYIKQLLSAATVELLPYINIQDVSIDFGWKSLDFKSFGLQNCGDDVHKCAMLALVTSEMLKKYGDAVMLNYLIMGYAYDDSGEYDNYRLAVLKNIVRIEKEYAQW